MKGSQYSVWDSSTQKTEFQGQGTVNFLVAPAESEPQPLILVETAGEPGPK